MPTEFKEEKMKQKGLLERWFKTDGWEERKGKNGEDIITFSASSEYAVERWWGTEVLSHEPGAVILDRAKMGAMPLLWNHDMNAPLGMIVGARVEGKRLMVDATMFKTPRAIETKSMMDGGLRNVSIRYQVRVIEEDIKAERFTATEWEPHEVSIVTVPADPTVGIGRGSDGDQEYEVKMRTRSQPAVTNREGTMTPEEQAAADAAALAATRSRPNVEVIEADSKAKIQGMEKDRIRGIENICTTHKIDDRYKDYWIRGGLSLDKVTDELLLIMAEREKTNPQSKAALGMSESEAKQFSLVRAIQAAQENNWTQAPYEMECSREIGKRLGKPSDPRRFFVPYEVQARKNETPMERIMLAMLQRDMTVGAGGQGGFLVQTSNVGFIELLRNMSVLFNMGATRMSGLRDSITIPKQTVAATTTWLANEAAQISEANQTFVQVALSPKTVGGYTEISRQLMLQSNPSIEGIVSADLARVVALDIDLKGLNGSGAAGQPTGIINTAGIGSVTGTSLAYDDIVEFQTDVFAGNALSQSSGFVTTGAVAGLCKQRVKFTSTASPLWEGRLEMGTMDGYKAMASNQMPTANMLFGDFSQVIVAEWGVLEIEVNPFADFKAGIVGVRAIATIDIGVRYPTAFSLATSIT